MEIELIAPGLKVQFVPDEVKLDACYQYGQKIGQAVAA